MAYDLNGAWANYTGINAPLHPRDDEVGDQIYLNVVSTTYVTYINLKLSCSKYSGKNSVGGVAYF